MPPKSKRFVSHRLPRNLQSNSTHISVVRLRKLQELLEEVKADALLCVLGIDGRYNEGMLECVNYLLFGLFESTRTVLISSEGDDDVVDDLIICVKPNAVDVYCNPINYTLILPYIASWPDLHIHCLSQSQYESNDDLAEEFKIKCFVSMVSTCKRVAVPYFSHHQTGNVEFDRMSVERWPIIQAYALEGYGSGTFFTLQHDVTEVSTNLSKVYEKFDAVSAERFILEELSIFERQWDGLGKTVDVARMVGLTDGFTESNAAESLVTYFSHGRVGANVPEDELSLWQRPFVYMGVQTRNVSEEAGRVPTIADINTAGVGGTRALHMVCHGVAPRSGLMCTRTYFFDSSSLPPFIESDKEYRNLDVEQLSRAYRTCIEVTLKSITDYAETLQPRQVVENAKKSVFDGLQKYMDCRNRRLEVVVKIETRLADGRHIPVNGETTPQSPVTMSIVINNISSVGGSGSILGAVAYSDTFLLSAIKHESPDDGRPVLNTETLLLTQNIPRWTCWNISEECARLSTDISSVLTNPASHDEFAKHCGEQLIDGQYVEIVSPQAWLQPMECTLYLYAQAVILMNSAVGPITLTTQEIKSANFYDGGGPSVPAFVTLYTSMDFQTKLPIQLRNTTRMLVISLSPRTKAYKQFFEQVFDAWKGQEGSNFSLSMEDTLPEVLSVVHEKLAAKFKSQITRPLSKLTSRTPAISDCHLTGLQQFLSHIAVSACLRCDRVVEDPALLALLRESESTTIAPEEVKSTDVMLTISVISGIPGSYKENVAQFITKLTQERSRWVIHNQTAETCHYFDASKLENTLSYVYNVLKKKSNAGSKSSRMLVITPGYTDIQTVVSVIQNHPSRELRNHIRIGAVTTCVDPQNSYISGYYTVPGLLNQCAHGWVNNIVLTNSSDPGNDKLAQVQNLIRAANPAVSFILTERGELTRSQDIELILSESAFQQPELLKSRLLLQCQYRKSAESYGMNTIVLNFSQPLIKAKLLSKLRDLHAGTLNEPLDGTTLYACGRMRLAGSDELMDLSCAPVSNTSKFTATQLKPGDAAGAVHSFMSFTGFSLTELKLKNMLRDCVAAKPQKKEYLTLQSVDRNTRNTIHKEKHLEPLPPGWFYNGSQYVDISGERTDRHPEFDKFLQEYVDKQNELIREFNRGVEDADYHDLFE